MNPASRLLGHLIKAAILTGLAFCLVQSLDLQLGLATDHWHRPSLRGDSWMLVDWQDKNTLRWIFSQHNEHRLLWHKLGTLIENRYFNLAAGQSAIAQIVLLEAACVGLWFWLCNRLLKQLRSRVLIGLRSLRKNRQKRRVPPSRDLITRCSGWISLIQRFRTPDFRRFAPLGLPGSRLIGTHLGNPLLMPPPSPV